MFKRRTPLSTLQNLKQMLWPSMGWARAYRYVRLRVLRLSDSSRRVAAGLALGVSVSFTPIIGTHIIQAMVVARLLRVNMLAAAVGTIVGNPWSFPFMWWAAIKVGSVLFGLFGLPASTVLPTEMSFDIFLGILWNEPLRVVLPWLLGGYVLAALTWPISYFIFYRLVKGARVAMRKVKKRRVHKVAKEVTGQKK